MHCDASICAPLFPLSQTLVGPVQQLLNVVVMPGDTPLQFPGFGACAVAARFNAADMHCRMSCTCCEEVLLLFESVPTEHMSSVEETGVAAAVFVTTRPQLGRPLPSTACVICGCVPQKPGVRVKHWLHVPLSVKTQPEDGLHVSFVHALLSLQVIGVCWQPSWVSQVSVVHALLSLQLTVEC
jgi:hypothetical protein